MVGEVVPVTNEVEELVATGVVLDVLKLLLFVVDPEVGVVKTVVTDGVLTVLVLVTD